MQMDTAANGRGARFLISGPFDSNSVTWPLFALFPFAAASLALSSLSHIRHWAKKGHLTSLIQVVAALKSHSKENNPHV